ncbi:MAG: DUF1343 domain-containing protein [Bacteroidales bacterium]|jgi:uncharacterized protein YbbC (DUF1343 family)|nr:DUF1343 domain-containing protein [Bacteroidales bacterium]
MKCFLPVLFCFVFAACANAVTVFERNATYAVVSNEPEFIDNLLSDSVKVVCIFAPEHGFRGNHEAGAHINNEMDAKTGLPIYSLHGKTKKPTKEQLNGIECIIFNLQDVGVRFYTYISTLHYVMEAAAENNVKVIVIDKPNPNCHYVDGPVLKPEYRSFVGMHTVPVVYGMTIGEYALMLNGEYWLKDSLQCQLQIVQLQNYKRDSICDLPNPPSPNLSNKQSIALYPSLCFFEGTNVSVGRGTEFPFQCFGHPDFEGVYDFCFVPQAIKGKSEHSVLYGEKCYGPDLRGYEMKGLYLQWLLDAYRHSKNKTKFFNSFFEKLAGSNILRKQIEAGLSEKEIRQSWQRDLERFKKIRKKYLLY